MTIEEAWLRHCKTYGLDSLNRNTYQTFKAGWEAAMAKARSIVYGGEEWKLLDNDQA